MKLTLNKKKLKNLSKDAQILPTEMTPNIAGAGLTVNDTHTGNLITQACANLDCGNGAHGIPMDVIRVNGVAQTCVIKVA
jgi:hypothetical protein